MQRRDQAQRLGADSIWASRPRANSRRPELELLLQCASAVAGNEDQVVELVRNGLNWEGLAEAAEFHGLAPILYDYLNRLCPELVPESTKTHLRDCYHNSVKRNLIFTAKMLALLKIFEEEGVTVLPLKGPTLAASLYPDPAFRPCSDLDLLVRKQDVSKTLQVFTRQGYRLPAHHARLSLRRLMSHRAELLLHHESAVPVDLQWETAPLDFPFFFDSEVLWRTKREIQIGRQNVPYLSPECLMLFLCVHGTKHVWSRLQWLGDVARVAHASPDWDAILELANETECVTPLLLGLQLAHEFLAAPVPEAILNRARETEAIVRLDPEVISRWNCLPPVEPGSLDATAFNARLASGAWKKVRHFAAMFNAPTDVELKLLPLPEKLFFLYYPFRGGRLAFKYFHKLLSIWPNPNSASE